MLRRLLFDALEERIAPVSFSLTLDSLLQDEGVTAALSVDVDEESGEATAELELTYAQWPEGADNDTPAQVWQTFILDVSAEGITDVNNLHFNVDGTVTNPGTVDAAMQAFVSMTEDEDVNLEVTVENETVNIFGSAIDGASVTADGEVITEYGNRTDEPPADPPADDPPADPTEADEFFALLNDYRSDNGLHDVEQSETLNAEAAVNNAGDEPHSFLGQAEVQNWASGPQDAPSVLLAWQESPGHNRILLSPNVQYGGIAHDMDTGEWTYGGSYDAVEDPVTETLVSPSGSESKIEFANTDGFCKATFI